MPELPLDLDAAEKAVGYFDNLRLPDVPGHPRFAEAGADWFREIVGAVFGSLVGQDRMVREVFALIPKKNSKTTAGAALMLVALLLNSRPRAEFLLIGPTKTVADLAFEQAAGMIDCDREGYLQRIFKVTPHIREIEYRRTKAKLLIKAFDSSVLTGVKPAGVLIDELHEISRNSSASRIIGQVRGGLLPNPEAFLIFITTQSDQPPAGAFKAELDTARAIRDGKTHGRMLPIIYEFPERIAKPGQFTENPPWYDSKLWWQVTPNRGKSITIERLEEDFEVAKAKGLQEVVRWASQHLNIQIGTALRSDGWAGAIYWSRGVELGLTLDDILERSEAVTIGIDGGGLDDLLGIAVIGRERDTHRWLGWAHAFISPEGMSRREANAPRYRDFEADGDLTIVDELPDDVSAVIEIVGRVKVADLLCNVGLDPMGVGILIDALAEIGVTQEAGLLVGTRQGIGLMGAAKTIERKLVDGTFKHGGQPLMAWCSGNAKLVATPTATRIARDESGYGKIDPLIALFNAADSMSRNPQPKRKPSYQMFFVGRGNGPDARPLPRT